MLEEPPENLAIDDPKVVAARKTLFGAWKATGLHTILRMTWSSKDRRGGRVAFLMYPQAECGNARLDCLDPDTFKYCDYCKGADVRLAASRKMMQTLRFYLEPHHEHDAANPAQPALSRRRLRVQVGALRFCSNCCPIIP